MQKPLQSPTDETRHWPLVLGVMMLVTGSVLYWRLGHVQVAAVLAALAVLTPMAGYMLRAYLSSTSQPRIRQVVVNVRSSTTIASIPLESAKYLTPASRSGLRESDVVEAREWLKDPSKVVIPSELAEERP